MKEDKIPPTPSGGVTDFKEWTPNQLNNSSNKKTVTTPSPIKVQNQNEAQKENEYEWDDEDEPPVKGNNAPGYIKTG